MKHLYIFTNYDSLCDSYSIVTEDENKERVKEILNGNDNQINIDDNFTVTIFSDDIEPTTLSNATFIALHDSKQGGRITDWKSKNMNAMVKAFSHSETDGTFYKVVIPKLLDNTLTLDDVLRFFPSTLESALRLLHDIYDGKPKSEFDNKANELLKADDMSDAKTAYKTLVTNGNDWKYEDSEEDRTKLAKLRDELLKVAV